jgi:hypothetical protein
VQHHWITSSARGEQCGGDGKAKRLGGLKVDDKLDVRRLLDWKIGRSGSLQDYIDIGGHALLWRSRFVTPYAMNPPFSTKAIRPLTGSCHFE